MKKLLLGAVLALAGIGGAWAQAPTLPQVTSVGATDLFQDFVGGAPSAASTFATAAQISGPQGYVKAVPLTAFSLAFANGQSWYLIAPVGTLATGTFTLAPNPGNGQRNCMRSTQTQTAVTIQVAAGSGQTITNVATAMTANTTYCYIFNQPTGTWDLI